MTQPVRPNPAAADSTPAAPTVTPPTSAEAMRDGIRALAAGASLETSAKQPGDLDAFAPLLRDGMDVYVAWIPGRPLVERVAVAARLRRLGVNPVPHLAAREIPSEAALRELLGRLRQEAGVERVLAIAGDTATAGPFPSSLALLETGLLEEHGIRRVDVAAYPEGHPKISAADLVAALDAKESYAARHGLHLTLITQFCFDAATIAQWLGALRARGVTLPVCVGLAGPATVRTLLAYASRCGIGASARALGTRTASVGRLLTERGPEAVVRGLVEQGIAHDVAGVHLFSFGGERLTARWLSAVADGRFKLDDAGFQVE
jgi:methylenetetrahydrofolate reductase (NADPH)